MIFGVNLTQYMNVAVGTAGLTAVRAYHKPSEGTHGVPTSWSTAAPGLVLIDSIHPDPAMVADGALDTELIAFIEKGKPGYRLCAWHEGNLSSHHLTPAMFLAVQAKMQALVTEVANGVIYGTILGAYAVTSKENQDLSLWVPPETGWVGIDGYSHNNATPEQVFGKSFDYVTKKTPEVPLMINETMSADAATAGTYLMNAFDYAVSLPTMIGYSPFFGNGNSSIDYQSAFAPVMAQIAIDAANAT